MQQSPTAFRMYDRGNVALVEVAHADNPSQTSDEAMKTSQSYIYGEMASERREEEAESTRYLTYLKVA